MMVAVVRQFHVDALYADRSGVRLLKCLCQTEDEKTVTWHFDARSLERLFQTEKESQKSSDGLEAPPSLASSGHQLPAA